MSAAMIFNQRNLLIGIACFLVCFLVADTLQRHRYLQQVTGIRTNELPIESTQISPAARARTDVLPPSTMDGRWWVIHAEAFLRGSSWRVRHTSLDNAPLGREVHWSSGLIWLLGALAKLEAGSSGASPADFVPQAAFWAGPCMLLFSIALLAGVIVPRFGAAIAAVFLLIYCSSPLIYKGFRAGETDHHGLVTTFAVACLVCLLAGGGGLISKKGRSGFLPSFRDARRWFVLSGLLGGAALWVSAASFIPILVGCGIGALLVFALRDTENSLPDARLWRIWGGAGFASSMAFYLLEYFPGGTGWRLEVNHPLYALAWLGAGDLLARLLCKLEGKSPFPSGLRSVGLTALSLVCVILPPALILSDPARFFWVSDQFLLLLHNEFIHEFQSIPKSLEKAASLAAWVELFTWPAFICLGAMTLWLSGGLSKTWKALLGLALVPAVIMQGLALWQIRWSILSTAVCMVGVIVLLAAYLDRRQGKAFPILLALAMLLAVFPFPLGCIRAAVDWKSRADVAKAVIPTVIARDIAHRLLQSCPAFLPVVLSGPTTSSELNYYGGVKTLGTLYWENLDGLKRAATIFAAPDEQTAQSLIKRAGVTHIVVSTWDNFGRAYVELLRSSGASVPGIGETFIETLALDRSMPDWIRPLYYPIPPGFDIPDEKVRIYQVVPDQSRFQALVYRGIYHFEAGENEKALELLSSAELESPGDPQVQSLISNLRKRLSK